VSEPVTGGIAYTEHKDSKKSRRSDINIKLNAMVEWLPHLPVIRKILGSNLSRKTEYPDLYFSGFLQPIWANSRRVGPVLIQATAASTIHQQFYII
jgi:hypothetical protein